MIIWGIPKMVVPPKHPKWSFLVGKSIVVGYHHFRKHPYVSVSKPSATWDFAVILSMSKFLNCEGKHLFLKGWVVPTHNDLRPVLFSYPINSMELTIHYKKERVVNCVAGGLGTNPVFNCTHPQVSLQRLHSKAWRKAARRMGERWGQVATWFLRLSN